MIVRHWNSRMLTFACGLLALGFLLPLVSSWAQLPPVGGPPGATPSTLKALKEAFQALENEQQVIRRSQEDLERARLDLERRSHDVSVKLELLKNAIMKSASAGDGRKVEMPGPRPNAGLPPDQEADLDKRLREVERKLDQLIEASKKPQAQKAKLSQPERIAALEKALILEDQRIAKLKDALKTLAKTLGSADPRTLTLKQQHALDTFFMAKRELVELDKKIRENDSMRIVKRGGVRQAQDERPAPEQIDAIFAKHSQVKEQERNLADLENKIKEYGKNVIGNNAYTARLESELKDGRARLQKLKAEMLPEITKMAQDTLYRERQAALDQIEAELQTYKKQRDIVTAQLADSKKAYNIELLRQEITEAEQVRNLLRVEKERLAIESLR